MDNNHEKFSAKRQSFDAKKFFVRWEWILLLIIIAVIIINGSISSKNYNLNSVLDSFKVYLDKSFMVFSMALVLMIGGIDISVASTAALSGTVMGTLFLGGMSLPAAIVCMLLVGILCGMGNGFLMTKFSGLAPMILSLGTMSLYRGIAWIILQSDSAGGFPDWYYSISSGTAFTIGGVSFPIIFVCFIICAVVFGFVLHKTTFGKQLHMIGFNPEAARYSTINVNRQKFIVYTISGLMAAVTGLFLTSRISTVRPNIAMNYEMEVIAICVLGGFKTTGGIGTILGAVLSTILIAMIRFGFGRMGVRQEIISVIVGILLIVSILVPNLISLRGNKKKQLDMS